MRTLIIAFLALTSVASAQTEYEFTTSDWPTKTYLAHRDTVAHADIGQFYGQHLPTAYQAIAGAGLVLGAATGLYWSLDKESGTFDMSSAVPFAGDARENLPDGFEIVAVPESQALSTDYYGPYESLSEAHEAFDTYMQAEEIAPAFLVVEEYVTDPTTEPDSSKWLTRIHYLVAR
jgi:effector-binding domain-containing protein